MLIMWITLLYLKKEAISELFSLFPKLQLFVIMDLSLYFLYIVYCIIMTFTIKTSNLKIMQAMSLLFIIAGYAVGQWGYFVAYSESVVMFKNDLKLRVSNTNSSQL
jgi:hypothetical protein